MKSPARQPRRYDASGRQEQARQNRRAVLDAAHRLFVERGYSATAVAEIAAAAGVSVETVYKAFGNKPALVKAVFDVLVVGDDDDVPMMQREFVQRNIAEPDPRRKLQDYGDHLAALAAARQPDPARGPSRGRVRCRRVRRVGTATGRAPDRHDCLRDAPA